MVSCQQATILVRFFSFVTTSMTVMFVYRCTHDAQSVREHVVSSTSRQVLHGRRASISITRRIWLLSSDGRPGGEWCKKAEASAPDRPAVGLLLGSLQHHRFLSYFMNVRAYPMLECV